MILNEFERPLTALTVYNILNTHFGYTLPVTEMTVKKAQAVLEELCSQIQNFRTSASYFVGEREGRYLSMLATARFLTEYLRDKKILIEAPAKDPTVFYKGVSKGIGHGMDTSVKFVPHVAGSAIGAFVGGLKGEALSSEAGRIKTAEIDIDNDIEQHFKQYDVKTKKILKKYTKTLVAQGKAGKEFTPQEIEAQLEALEINPLKTITDPKLKKETIDYFVEKNREALPKNNTEKTTVATPEKEQSYTNNQVYRDVGQSLVNHTGSSKRAVKQAMRTAIAKDKSLLDDEVRLYTTSLNIIKGIR